jgi:hypothetical protein
MNKDFAVMTMFLCISATINVGLVIAWFRASQRLRRLEKRELEIQEPEDRSVQLERALESLAAQVDQLASGQEFLNRVIAERRDASRGLLEPPREITPH